jgi:hypothetical protein
MHSPAVFADACLFMGMHSCSEPTRVACKNFFIRRVGERLLMTLDQVGLCDDVVWQRPSEMQDLYFPFMDRLHTLLGARRLAYTQQDIHKAEADPRLRSLDGYRALLLARVINEHGVLYTTDPILLRRPDLPVRTPENGMEMNFPEPIEAAYQASLTLRVGPMPLTLARREPCFAG